VLGLKLPTDPRWVNIAEQNIKEILIDHAFCEQKAASTAISLLITHPEFTELAIEMSALAKEEMSHFQMVHQHILKRGWVLGRERKDPYVQDVMAFFPKTSDRDVRLVHRLLVAALIEARSCERFRLLSEELQDQELAQFYKKLMVSEANHYTMFLKFARQYGNREEVDIMWEELLVHEANILKNYNTKGAIHG
jgi:tRNA-(ms[2]io[6]A)-hydroxylase